MKYISYCMSMQIKKPLLYSKKVISYIDNIYCWYMVNKCNLLLGVPIPKPSCNNQKNILYKYMSISYKNLQYHQNIFVVWMFTDPQKSTCWRLDFNFGDVVTLLNIFGGPVGRSNIIACGLEKDTEIPGLICSLSLCSLASI